LDEKALAAWSVAQKYKKSTTSTRLSDIRAIEKVYGDLEDLYAQDGLEGLLKELAYTSKDKAANRPNPSKLPLWGDTYRDLSHLRATVNYYRRFKTGAARQTKVTAMPDLAAIEAAIAEYLDLGPLEFMDRYSQAWDEVSVYLLKDSQILPARAIVAVAGQYMADAIPPEDSAVDERMARKHLDALDLVTAELPPVLLFAKDGQYFAPAKQKNRSTGATAFTYRPPGANNERAEAIEVGDWAGIARALLVDGRAVRIQPWLGKGKNYLTYPGQKFADCWLRPDIADSLGMAPGTPSALSSPVEHSQVESRAAMTQSPTNLILFGPPGTGKTWSTAEEAVRLCDGDAPADRDALMVRYRALLAEKRIGFITFHQSMDYETFVEGLRPETEASETGEAGFRLEPTAGIFREFSSLANEARTRGRQTGSGTIDLDGRRFWKMSLGAAGVEDDIYQAALDGAYIVIGWGGDIDWTPARFDDSKEIRREWTSAPRDNDAQSNYSQLAPFRNELKAGDIVIIPNGNKAFRAVGEVQGDYEYVPGQDGNYCHRRRVKWHLTLDEPLPLETIVEGKFTMRTIYPIATGRVNKAALSRLLGGDASPSDAPPDQFVLIIDEINRANVSKVFGELITLIEPDKRLGQANALEVTLPHSRQPFGVPDNLHILGTMNTADRSIAILDTALRRRFQFKEMPPKPETLQEAASQSGLPLVEALRAMNDRIEYLLDRDHRIGHAYLVACRTKQQVHAAFRDKIIPLLQEYFFEDWSKVAAILNEKPSTSMAGKGAFLDWRRLSDPTASGGPARTSWEVRSVFADDAVVQLARTQPQSSGELIAEDAAETTAEAQ
jgi:5-methylcytosine-specific restriction protein B